MSGANIPVRCMGCAGTYVTSQFNFDWGRCKCPACGSSNSELTGAKEAWQFKIDGGEWEDLSARTSFLVVHEDQAAVEAAKEHWRRNLPGFKSVELEVRSPVGHVSRWVVGVEHRPQFMATRRE